MALRIAFVAEGADVHPKPGPERLALSTRPSNREPRHAPRRFQAFSDVGFIATYKQEKSVDSDDLSQILFFVD
ncbi:hypothetical protein [Pseudomonas sp. DTU12.3]|uniref:hypothetical protein n=1 Tax=Pseudomonas sp. DTU12.3 TaxID=2073078 RepID=UPI00101319A2|nr:hypothetical protein [Pseudomonas sp. DTU12.3]